jgi:hypothetical protein
MSDSGRVIIAVLVVLSLCALITVLGIKYVRGATRAAIQAHESRDTEAQK